MTDQTKQLLSGNIQYISLFIIICLLDISCSKNALFFKHKKYFTERNKGIIKNDSIELYQIVFYNKPNTIDEEFSHFLTFKFPKSDLASQGAVYYLPSDSAILKLKYDLFSIWNWEKENTSISGMISILDFQPTSIKLKEDITIVDFRRNRILNFKGKRRFALE